MSALAPKPVEVPIESLKGIGPKRAAQLRDMGISNVRDLLFHFPRDYQDRRTITSIADLSEGDEATVAGEVIDGRSIRLRNRMSIAIITIRDESGKINATWFGRGFLVRSLRPGTKVLLTGKVGQYKGLALRNPDYEVLTDNVEDALNTGRIVPVYRLTEKVTQRMMRRWIRDALDSFIDSVEDALPKSLRTKHGFSEVASAIERAHFPTDNVEQGQAARERFAYEELLTIQLGVLASRAERIAEENGLVHDVHGPNLRRLVKELPFTLTGAQQRVVADVLEDMHSPRAMARLIQGDVGCGKTIVAVHAIAAATDGGFQTAVMAPTEVLAEQHYRRFSAQLASLGLSVTLLTGSSRGKVAVREQVANGTLDVVVGTHALIQDSTAFKALGLVVIDEQHRFGVAQRAQLEAKGPRPDVLHMTATPIPRTLAITVYGGMDISVIDELPPGRSPVITECVDEGKLAALYADVCKQAARGLQTFIICPLVEESEKRALRAVTSHYSKLSQGPFSKLRTDLIHGRLPSAEKDAIMHRFEVGETQVLFSTTVIEVGIDVAAATIMIIEDAAQFGLTQLHQLRGRVGRGAEPGRCYLVGKPKTEEGKHRLSVMCETCDGFRIAEEDLVLRGPGEFHGLRQAGMSDLRVADLIRDTRLLEKARRDAQNLLLDDPPLKSPELATLVRASERYRKISY